MYAMVDTRMDPFICSLCCKPTYVNIKPYAFDNHQEDHDVFKGFLIINPCLRRDNIALNRHCNVNLV